MLLRVVNLEKSAEKAEAEREARYVKVLNVHAIAKDAGLARAEAGLARAEAEAEVYPKPPVE